MPSKSKAQSRMMFAAAKDPKVAKKVGVSQEVAGEFAAADKKRGIKQLMERRPPAGKTKPASRPKAAKAAKGKY